MSLLSSIQPCGTPAASSPAATPGAPSIPAGPSQWTLPKRTAAPAAQRSTYASQPSYQSHSKP